MAVWKQKWQVGPLYTLALGFYLYIDKGTLFSNCFYVHPEKFRPEKVKFLWSQFVFSLI